jgi:hypothetical protein
MVSITPARTMRVDPASVAARRVSMGSTNRRGCARALSPGESSDTGGSRPSHVKNTMMSSEPMTNSGSETTASELVVIA